MSAKRLVYTTVLYICEGDCHYRLGEPYEEKRLCCSARAQAEADK